MLVNAYMLIDGDIVGEYTYMIIVGVIDGECIFAK
jgi:hypothetical protein